MTSESRICYPCAWVLLLPMSLYPRWNPVLTPLCSGWAILVVPRAWWIGMTEGVGSLFWLSR